MDGAGSGKQSAKYCGSHYRENNRPHLDSLKGEIGNKTTNRITYIEIHELNLPEGRVVMFQIPAAPQGLPVAWEGHYYGRDGEQLVPLNLAELEQIRRQATRVDWSASICSGATINDLDTDAIIVARENFKIKNQRLSAEVAKWDDATFLNKAKVTINGQYYACGNYSFGKARIRTFYFSCCCRHHMGAS
jgi:ATP-dependent DNA helicase RecG